MTHERVPVSVSEAQVIKALADAAGLTRAAYIRRLIGNAAAASGIHWPGETTEYGARGAGRRKKAAD